AETARTGTRRQGRARGARDQRVLALELAVGQLADLDRAQDPLAIDEVRLWPRSHPVGVANHAGRILHRRPRRTELGNEVASRPWGVDEEHADHGQAVV